MNRRRFMQSLLAVVTLPAAPALSIRPALAAAPAAVAVPTQARFWAIYMSALHGECTPAALQNLLHIPSSEAKTYVAQLIADGAIKPNPIAQKAVTELVKSSDEGLLDKVKKRFEMKSSAGDGAAQPMRAELSETVSDPLDLQHDIELVEEEPIELETTNADDEFVEIEPVEIESGTKDLETEVQALERNEASS